MNHFRTVLILGALCLSFGLAAGASAQDAPEVVITQAWARPTAAAMPEHNMEGMGEHEGMAPSSGFPSAAYFTIENRADYPVLLTEVATPAAMLVQMHQTRIENDVARMSEVGDGVEILPGDTVQFMPGGFHVMLLDLMRDLIPGDTIGLALTFIRGDGSSERFTVTIGAVVQDLPPETDGLAVTGAQLFTPDAAPEALTGIDLGDAPQAIYVELKNTSDADAPFSHALWMEEQIPLQVVFEGELQAIDEYDVGAGESAAFVILLDEALDLEEAAPLGALPLTLVLSDEREVPFAVPLSADTLTGTHEGHDS